MRALLIAAGGGAQLEPLSERMPSVLLPLLDRPFVQHVVEALVDQGVTRIDVVLHRFAEQVEQLLGDGTRWGVEIVVHLTRDPADPYRPLQLLALGDEPLLLAAGDRLPLLPVAELRSQPCAYVVGQAAEGDPAWSGWAWIPPTLLAELPSPLSEAQLAAALGERGAAVPAPTVLAATSFAALLAAQRAMLAGEASGLLRLGREVEPGVWLSSNVVLHPTAQLTPPLFIGANCRVHAGVQLGPGVVVGPGCVLDERTTVADSLILAGSYVGEGLELDQSIVAQNLMINVPLDAAITITDDFILSSVQAPALGAALSGALTRLLALALALPLLPLLLLLRLLLGSRGVPVVRLPAPPEAASWRRYTPWRFTASEPDCSWRDLLCRVLPGLLDVALGRVRWVGITPRTPDQLEALPSDWRALLRGCKGGLISELQVVHGAGANRDERYAAEAFYAAASSPGHDLGLLLGYAARVLGLIGRRREAAAPSTSQHDALEVS